MEKRIETGEKLLRDIIDLDVLEQDESIDIEELQVRAI